MVTVIDLDNKVQESFYNWFTNHHESSSPLGIHYKNPSYPHYTHLPEHKIFLDTNCVGKGSCIYNTDIENDWTLDDCRCTSEGCAPKIQWAENILDSDKYNFVKRYGYVPNTDGCMCNK